MDLRTETLFLIREIANVDYNPSPRDGLMDDLALDSLDRTSLVIAIEEAFGVKIAEGTEDSWFTVEHVLDAVERAAAEQGRTSYDMSVQPMFDAYAVYRPPGRGMSPRLIAAGILIVVAVLLAVLSWRGIL
jgi:acyl carrier protein